MSLGETAQRYENLLREKKLNAASKTDLSEEQKLLEKEMLEEMGLSGMQNVKTEGGTNFYRYKQTIVCAKKGISTAQLCHELAQHEDTRRIVTPGFNANTLSSLWKEMLKSGKPVPPELAEMLQVIEIDRVGARK